MTSPLPVDENGDFFALQPYELADYRCGHAHIEVVDAEPSVGIFGNHVYCEDCHLSDDALWESVERNQSEEWGLCATSPSH